MSQKKKRFPALAAFLPVGIAFIAIGISGSSAFIPIGCAFLGIGIVGIAGSRKAAREETPPDESNSD